MNRYLPILGCTLSLGVNAQVTFTLSDAPQVGDVLYYEDLSGAFTSLPGGPSQVWDLSCPDMAWIVPPDSFLLIDPTQTAGWPYFTSATVAGTGSVDPGTSVEYFRASEHGLENIGEYQEPGTPYLAPDPQLLMPYPCTYGDAWLDTTLWCLDTTICLVHHEACAADGLGTLIMPAGTIGDVLRIRCVEERTTDVDGELQVETFTNDRYWKPGFPMYLVWVSSYRYQFGQEEPVETFSVRRLMDLTSRVGSPAAPAAALHCRYDPVNGMLLFTCSDPTAVRSNVLDGQGRVIATRTVQGKSDTSHPMTMSLGNLASGTYLLQVMAKEKAYVVRFAAVD